MSDRIILLTSVKRFTGVKCQKKVSAIFAFPSLFKHMALKCLNRCIPGAYGQSPTKKGARLLKCETAGMPILALRLPSHSGLYLFCVSHNYAITLKTFLCSLVITAPRPTGEVSATK